MMKFDNDQYESLVGDFESIKEQNEYPVNSTLSVGSHETDDRANSRMNSRLSGRSIPKDESMVGDPFSMNSK